MRNFAAHIMLVILSLGFSIPSYAEQSMLIIKNKSQVEISSIRPSGSNRKETSGELSPVQEAGKIYKACARNSVQKFIRSKESAATLARVALTNCSRQRTALHAALKNSPDTNARTTEIAMKRIDSVLTSDLELLAVQLRSK